MTLEVEVKFYVQDFSTVEAVLARSGSLILPWHLESNLVFDTERKDFQAQGTLLRVRSAVTSCLTLKRIPERRARPAGAKVRREDECDVRNAWDMVRILSGLGYVPVLGYQKFRRVWRWGNCLICQDILPFGRFWEIEGRDASIWEAVRDLGLPRDKALDRDYLCLRHSLSLPEDADSGPDFCFDLKVRNHLARELGAVIPEDAQFLDEYMKDRVQS
jgi:adenylate cyclase class 2